MGKTVPVKNQMNSVFIHVTDLKAAVKWYADLLGLEVDIDKVASPVYNIPVVGTTSLTLDDHTFDQGFKHKVSSGPIFNFYAPNIDEAYQYVKHRGIAIVREVEWVADTAWFNIGDPDGNIVMICNC